MAFSRFFFVISAAMAAAACEQRLSGEIYFYAGMENAAQMVLSFRAKNMQKTNQGDRRMFLGNVKS